MIEVLASIHSTSNPGFTAGIVLWDDVVIEAAPILHYMKKQKWNRSRVREYCQTNGWTVSVVHRLERPRV